MTCCRQQFELAHDMLVRHAGEEEAADEVVHADRRLDAADGGDALVGVADDEAVAADLVVLADRRALLAISGCDQPPPYSSR